MQNDVSPENQSFEEWFNSLSDDEQCMALDWLYLIAEDLGVEVVSGCREREQALLSHNTLDAGTSCPPKFGLN